MKSKKLTKIIVIAMVSTIISSVMPISASAEWLKDSQNNWTWEENGTRATGWRQIDGAWYIILMVMVKCKQAGYKIQMENCILQIR